VSAIGTIIAAGVAPATHQASQVANRRHKRVQQQQRGAQRTREVFETHLETLEENDETETSARLRTDTQMQSSPHSPNPPGLELARVYQRHRRGHDLTSHAISPERLRSTRASLSRGYDNLGHHRPTRSQDETHHRIDVQG